MVKKTAIDMTGGLIGAFVNLITSLSNDLAIDGIPFTLLEIISEAFGEFIKPLMPIVDILVTKLSPLFGKIISFIFHSWRGVWYFYSHNNRVTDASIQST